MEKVPADALVLIVAGPQNSLTDHEIKAIDAYVENGGRLLVMLPTTANDGLTGLVKEWNVEVGDDIVVDQVVRLFAGSSLGVEPIADTYSSDHPITRHFRERTIFPMARSVEAAKSVQEGVEVTSLVKTTATSWGEKDIRGIFKEGTASFGPED